MSLIGSDKRKKIGMQTDLLRLQTKEKSVEKQFFFPCHRHHFSQHHSQAMFVLKSDY